MKYLDYIAIGELSPCTSRFDHCGTEQPGWLSGWATPQSGGSLPDSYSGAARHPAAAEGVVERTVCFDYNGPRTCMSNVQVELVRCWGFLLWRLPDVPDCDKAYCTAPSGL